MSLVYNNKKLIGKCSKYAIEKVQGTSPFVMLENFEPKQPQLNENQQNVLLIMKNIQKRWPNFHPSTVVDELIGLESEYHDALSKTEELQVFKIFMIWALEQEEE